MERSGQIVSSENEVSETHNASIIRFPERDGDRGERL